jgi:hypothetical protein
VTPDGKRMPPRPSPTWLIALRMLWPLPVAMVLMATSTVAEGRGADSVKLLLISILLAGFVTPATVAVETTLLMLRLPRRVRWAPVLLVVPRIVAIPILAALAAMCIGAIALLGAELIGIPLIGAGG